MQLLYARCAGLDVHARHVVACARIVINQVLTYERLTVPTTTELHRIRIWHVRRRSCD
jgi:hypothetical protein